MNEEIEWTLSTVEQFYEELEKKLKNRKTLREATEVLKYMFLSEKEFYRHIRRHILEEKYSLEVRDWKEAKLLDDKLNQKYSREYLEFFFETLTNLNTLIFQKRKLSPLPRVLIFSKLNSVAVIIEKDKVLSVMYARDTNSNELLSLEEFLKREEKISEKIFVVGVNRNVKEACKKLRERIERFRVRYTRTKRKK